MAFRGTNNLPPAHLIKRCQYGGDNNSKKNGGCGKHVEKLGQMVRSKRTGESWHVWFHLNYCKEHRHHIPGEYDAKLKHTMEGLEV